MRDIVSRKKIQRLIRTPDKHLFPPHAHVCTYINTYACKKGRGKDGEEEEEKEEEEERGGED